MKTLYILRHAKSDWQAGIADRDRPLSARGRQAAPLMGAAMKRRGYAPDFVLCSMAERARETCTLLLRRLGERPVQHLDTLYLASPAQLLRQIRSLDDAHDSVMLIGHNPGLQGLVAAIAGHGNRDALAQVQAKFPTGALAVLRFPVQRWADVGTQAGQLEAFLRPRELA